jgi:hypothetical protein
MSALEAAAESLVPAWPHLDPRQRADVVARCVSLVRRQIQLAPLHIRNVLHEDFGMKVNSRKLLFPSVVSDVARLVDWTIQHAHPYHQGIHVLSEMNLTIACVIDKAKRELGYRPVVELREGNAPQCRMVLGQQHSHMRFSRSAAPAVEF